MRKSITFVIFILASIFANSQNVYIKTFGKITDKPIIFLHGGPGYNCVNFEATSAKPLADKGFFVIVYDRQGEGRNKNQKAKYTFKETFEELNGVYEKYGIKKATLIGHSFGGVVATLFAEANPEKIQSIILVGTPISWQGTFKNILSKSKIIYQAKNDTTNLNSISLIEKMDKASIEYSKECLIHAEQNDLFSTKNSTPEALSIYSKLNSDTVLTKASSQVSNEAYQVFCKNEKLTTIDLTKNLEALLKQKVKIYGLYGKEDGLHSNEQLSELQNQIGHNNLKYFDKCSHSVFTDQQSQSIDAIKTWIK